jgi:hypothetical protein
MGSLYRFSCSERGYEAEVSGGLDYGMMCVAHTVSCPKCRELSDTTVSDEPWNPVVFFEIDAENGTVRDKRIRCGLDGRHTAALWEHPGPCPGCGTTLERDEEPTVMWD